MTSLPLTTSDVTQEVAIRMGEQDTLAGLPSTTTLDNWKAIVAKCGDKPALHQKIDGVWKTWTWSEFKACNEAFAKTLLHLGCAKFDIINILGFNSPEWFFSNHGAIAAGCVSAGIYATNNSVACKYISEHSKAKVVVCEGLKQLEKYYEISKDLPHLKAIAVYGVDSISDDIKAKVAVPVYAFGEFLKLGEDVALEKVTDRSDSWKYGEVCSLIYTSGTTGPPKAVMLTHDNITWTVRTMLKATKKGYLDGDDCMISYLPLSHIAAQMLDMYMPLETGCQVWFAQPDALKGTLGKTLKEVRPTIFFGVPRVWEKIYQKLQEVGRSTTGVKKMLSTWAKGVALQHWESLEFASTTEDGYFYYLSQILLGAAHQALGFDRCQNFFVSAAPIEVKILKYFMSLDVPILELFGQSECTGPHSVNTLDAFKVGSVGRPLLGTQTKMDPETGELCYTGRHIFAGYMGMEEKTKETVNAEGYLLSGDIVSIDSCDDPNIPPPSGFISITGRIKELIITAGGENIPPVLIEDELKAAMPALSKAMVIGDKRKYLVVLLCLEVEVDVDGAASDKLTGAALEAAKDMGSSATTTAEARVDPLWMAYFDNGLTQANKQATSRAQKVGKWALLDTDFTEVGGELTPTLKLKRSVAADKYSKVIEDLYAD